MSLFKELKRRNVVRVAIGYLAGAWLLIQILETLFPIFGMAETSIRVVVILLAIGLAPVLVLSWVFEWTEHGIRRDGDVATGVRMPSKRRFDLAVTVVLLLAVTYFAVDKFVFDPARDAAQIRAAREEGRVEGVLDKYAEKSIVVLPMLNLSPDPDQEYFADGLSEELLNLLTQVPKLRVISRTTAFSFKDKDIPVREIAGKLDVSHVLEGSVRKAGDRVRVTVQLIEARSDTQLWSQTYDRPLKDIFAIQDEISAQVVAQLKLRLVGGPLQANVVDPHAYELFLRAHYILESDQNDKLDEAEASMQQALELQPDWVTGMGELARVWFRQAVTVESMSWETMQVKVRGMVARMAEIAPSDNFTNAWQAYIADVFDNDYQAAADHYERAITNDPYNPAPLLRSAAKFLHEIGRDQEAYALARFDVARDPACVYCIYILGQLTRGLGREAAEYLEGTLAWSTPDAWSYWNLGAAWLFEKEPTRALEYFDKIRALDPQMAEFARLFALHDLGREKEFEKSFQAYRESNKDDTESIARVYAWIGDNDRAFAWLDRLAAEPDAELGTLTTNDFYGKLRSDPRWSTFLEKHGLADSKALKIHFNPRYPPELQQVIDMYRSKGLK